MDFFAPWLDKKFPNPAVGGEIRYAASVDGKDVWVDDGREFVLVDGVPVYEFERGAFKPEEVVKPLARTFIPSRVTDNPYLMGTGYVNAKWHAPAKPRLTM